MIDPNRQKPSSSTSIFNRSYTIHSTPTDFTKPSLNRSDSINLFPDSIKGKVRNLCNLFESRRSTKVKPKSIPEKSISPPILTESSPVQLPGTEDRVVIYFTSLRGIRRTYEDCYTVRMILKFFRVYIDERDVSMDCEYKKELLNVLREKHVTLPQVFIKGSYVGGADVIKQLHETGQLAKLLTGVRVRSTGAWQVCDGCGDVRFVPCGSCSGSKKVFDEDEDRLVRCVECNENGLVRCPVCCSV